MTIKLLVLAMIAVVTCVAIAYLQRQWRFRDSLHRKYSLSILGIVVVTVCAAEALESINPNLELPTLLLRSSALVVAILGFAAQPVIINIICGLLISYQKPFELGDRIVVDGHEPGLVEDITLRHTVLRSNDGIRIIIPNGELNSKTVTNTSYRMSDRIGIPLHFSVSYDTDVPKAMSIIRNCVAASPYTLGVETAGFHEDSGPVYFLKYDTSSLRLDTTIWVSRGVNALFAMSDVNTRVLEAFRKSGIEIPYPYLNIQERESTGTVTQPEEKKEAPQAVRYFKTNKLQKEAGENMLQDSLSAAELFAKKQKLNKRSSMQLQLLTEESADLFQTLLAQAKREFWIEGTSSGYRIHLRARVSVNTLTEYQKLLEISSSGKNEVVNTINRRILEAVLIGINKLQNKNKEQSDRTYKWSLDKDQVDVDEIRKSILGKIASGVQVSVTPRWVEMVVVKEL